MEDRKNVSNQGGQGQGNKPGKGGQQGGREGQGGSSDKPSTRPTPGGVPNEGRRTEGQRRELGHGAQERQGAYKGGRQETGGIPNPDDRDDDTSAGSFRGNANQETGAEDDNRDIGATPGRRKDVNRQTRKPA